MHINITDLEEGKEYTSVYILKSHSVKTNRNGGQYLDGQLMDESGTMTARMWEIPGNLEYLSDGGFVEATFTVGSYQGNKQAVLSKIVTRRKDEIGDTSGLVPSAPRSSKEMFWEIYNTADAFENDELKRVVMHVLKENQNAMLTMPAAKTMHHAVVGGLLQHVTGMLELAKAMTAVYTDVDKELLYAGVILHDIGKLREFAQGPIGLVTDYTEEGNMEGHIFMGAEYVSHVCDEEKADSELKLLLVHMILSHHGSPEMGSAVRPMTLESYLLHVIDDTDAKMNIITGVLNKTEPGTMSERVFALDNVRLYARKRESDAE